MNKLFFLTCCFLISATLHAQPKGFRLLGDLRTFQSALSKATASLATLQADFTQTKHLSLLSDKIVSKGKFYYRKNDKVRIEYTTPFQYLLIMNGGQILVKDEQKTTRINTRTSKVMQSVNRIMIDCMSGSVFSNPDFKITAYESGSNYLLRLNPVTDAMKKMFSNIDVYLAPGTMDVDKLVMNEQGGDYTEMDFSKSQHNLALNDALFKVK